MCVCESLYSMLAYLHWMQSCGFSPVCFLLIWTVEFLVIMLEYSHTVHRWFLSSRCVFLCLFREEKWVASNSHWLQWCSSCPVCSSMCLLRYEGSLHEKLHCVHLSGVSSEWLMEWVGLQITTYDFKMTCHTLCNCISWSHSESACDGKGCFYLRMSWGKSYRIFAIFNYHVSCIMDLFTLLLMVIKNGL